MHFWDKLRANEREILHSGSTNSIEQGYQLMSSSRLKPAASQPFQSSQGNIEESFIISLDDVNGNATN